MAIIPNDQQINTLSGFVNTKQAGSANTDRLGRYYIMQDITDTVRPYKLYTALITQGGGDNSLSKNSGNLDIGVTYFINVNSPGMDFTNAGAPNNDVGTYFVATETRPNSWGIDENKKNILYYNTGAPVVNVLENTIGNIWFNYSDPGLYDILSNDLFIDTKTTVNMFPAQFIESPVDIYNSTAILVNDRRIALLSYYNYETADSALSYGGPTMIEIRVYN